MRVAPMYASNINMADIKNINESPGVQNTRNAIHHNGAVSDINEKSLQLTSILQSTLELNKLLELFSDEAAAIVPHDGLHYVNNDEGYSCLFGEEALHRCSYMLVLIGKQIGELTFYRARRFEDTELKQLEVLMTALIYPLRNALLYKQALEKAYSDPLTGIGNRVALDNALAQELDIARRYNNALSIIVLDVDKFKQINDGYGHIAGDAILRRVADCMVESMRQSDIIYRYGGDEFVILLRSTNKDGAKLLAERIRLSVESAHERCKEFQVPVTISAGITAMLTGDTPESIIERCDTGLYEAKKRNRNCVVIAE